MRRIEGEIAAGATDKTRRLVGDAIDYWLLPTTPRPRHQRWSDSEMTSKTRYAKYYLRPAFRDLRCMDLKRKHIQAVVNLAPTLSEGKRVREACVSLLSAMRSNDWLLDNQVIDMSGVWWNGDVPDDGADEDSGTFVVKFVVKAKRPTHGRVRGLREAADRHARLVWWRGLMVELAAYSGLRQCELLALRPSDIDFVTRRIQVRRQVKRSGGFALPKGRKRRVTMFPTVTPTGYLLLEQLERRCGEVDPDGLLFGTSTGRPMSPSNFHRDIFEPAAMAAGWEWKWVEQLTVNGPKKVRSFRPISWHSLRHSFCSTALDEWGVSITDVSLLAGHANRGVTETLYISQAADALDGIGEQIQ